MVSADHGNLIKEMDFRGLQRFEIRDLCYFVALAEELHLKRAADKVGIHESPLSRAITNLEYRMRVRLFHRTRKCTRLTQAGQTLLSSARNVLLVADRVQKDAAALASGRKGCLRIGISDGLPAARIGRLLERNALEDPQVAFTIESYPLAAQLRALRNDLIDVGLAPSPTDDPLGVDLELVSIALRKDAMVIAVKPDHILAGQSVVRSLEAGTGPFILAGDSSIGSPEIAALFNTATPSQAPLHYVPSVDSLMMAVLAGQGVGLLAHDQTSLQVDDRLVFRPLGLSRAAVTTCLLKRREDHSAVVERFVERAKRLV